MRDLEAVSQALQANTTDATRPLLRWGEAALGFLASLGAAGELGSLPCPRAPSSILDRVYLQNYCILTYLKIGGGETVLVLPVFLEPGCSTAAAA